MRAQISLWMLTKFAMIFFIFAIALILGGFTKSTGNKLCSTQAEALVQKVASRIDFAINSPTEDSREIIAFESVLSVGKEDFVKYAINITCVPSSGACAVGANPGGESTGHFVVEQRTLDSACSATALAPFQKLRISFDSADAITLPNRMVLPIDPTKTRFVSVVKCSAKTLDLGETQPKRYLFLSTCNTPMECKNFDNYPQCRFVA